MKYTTSEMMGAAQALLDTRTSATAADMLVEAADEIDRLREERSDSLGRWGQVNEMIAEIDRLRARYVPCAVCQMPVDTWDECEGGNAYGCRLSRGRWACSIQCWDRFVVRSEIDEQVGGNDDA
jgi:hypothetical protein